VLRTDDRLDEIAESRIELIECHRLADGGREQRHALFLGATKQEVPSTFFGDVIVVADEVSILLSQGLDTAVASPLVGALAGVELRVLAIVVREVRGKESLVLTRFRVAESLVHCLDSRKTEPSAAELAVADGELGGIFFRFVVGHRAEADLGGAVFTKREHPVVRVLEIIVERAVNGVLAVVVATCTLQHLEVRVVVVNTHVGEGAENTVGKVPRGSPVSCLVSSDLLEGVGGDGVARQAAVVEHLKHLVSCARRASRSGQELLLGHYMKNLGK
jgi:hypothetical protein